MNRPRTYTIAAILQFLSSAFAVVASIPGLAQGATSFNQTTSGPPYVVVLIGTLVGAMGIVSAYGVWRNQKWGIILTLMLCVINGLLTMPGILFAPSAGVKLFAASGVVFQIIIIALLLWPRPTLVPASNQTARS
jgi:hypothetical protein